MEHSHLQGLMVVEVVASRNGQSQVRKGIYHHENVAIATFQVGEFPNMVNMKELHGTAWNKRGKKAEFFAGRFAYHTDGTIRNVLRVIASHFVLKNTFESFQITKLIADFRILSTSSILEHIP